MGDRLKEIREHNSFSQRELSMRSGVSYNSISRIEQNKVRARPSTVRRLAEALGVHPSQLTGK